MIHHVSIITGLLEENVNFYTKRLGMTFVKKTVNFDDPFTYHLYYGNKNADPCSIVTFFVHPGTSKGKKGKGVAHGLILNVPLEKYNELGDKIYDPEGLLIKLIPTDIEKNYYKILGVITTASKEFHEKFSLNSESEFVELDSFGEMGAGIIHHTAFATENEDTQIKLRESLTNYTHPSPVIDRFYFKSIYFQEPNGCLIEIATMGPGFDIDEDKYDENGDVVFSRELKLPPQYKNYRDKIESRLPKLTI